MRTTRELKTALGIALLFLTTLPTYAQGGFVPAQNITKGTANNQVARWDATTGKWIPVSGASIDSTGHLVVASVTSGGVLLGSYPWKSGGTMLTSAPTSINLTGAGQTLSAIGNDLTLTIPGYTLPVAAATVLGGVKQGSNVTIAGDGTLSVAAPYTLTSGGIATALGYTPLSSTDPSVTNSRTPSGAAGGDLSGTYPSPLLVSILSPGSVGDSTHVPALTYDAKGRVTAATSTAIAFPAAPVTSVFGRTGAVTLANGDLPQSPVFSGTVSATNLNLSTGADPGTSTINNPHIILTQVAPTYADMNFVGMNTLHLAPGYQISLDSPRIFFPQGFSPQLNGGSMQIFGVSYFTVNGSYPSSVRFRIQDSQDTFLNTADTTHSITFQEQAGQTANVTQVKSATNSVLQNVTAGGVENAQGYQVAGTAGYTGTIPLAKLTTGGANGSETFTGGILTSVTPPT